MCDVKREVTKLREEQEKAVMPLIGPLLDAWEGLPGDLRCDTREFPLGEVLDKIQSAMED